MGGRSFRGCVPADTMPFTRWGSNRLLETNLSFWIHTRRAFSAGQCQKLVDRIETATSIHTMLYPQSFLMAFNPVFKTADVIHYHIIHNQFISYLAFPWLSKLKPAVWSLHDPWALTGHCVHPFDCEGWKTGCRPCPHLDYPFAMRQDRAWLNYKLKDLAYRHSRLHLIVASRWMLRKVEQSPSAETISGTSHTIRLGPECILPGEQERKPKQN